MIITLDIETLPTDRADVIDSFPSQVKAPATHKKPETIAAWLSENTESEVDALHRKTALDGSFGRVCVIGVAVDDEDPEAFFEGSEADILSNFASFLDRLKSDKYQTQFVGHNIVGFDLRFLLQRYIVNCLPVPHLIRWAANAKPWDTDKVCDTMTMWAGTGRTISLDKLCKALSIPTPKDGIDGSKVYDYVLAGKIAEVADYCMRDVIAAREAYYRIK